MIKNEFFLISSIQYAATHPQDFGKIKGLSPREEAALRAKSMKMAKAGLASLGMIRMGLQRIPPSSARSARH